MEPIGFATLYTQPREIKGLGNVSPLWLGDAVTESGEARLYIKRAPNAEIVSECLCAVVGAELGLPIPRTFLVMDSANFLGGGILIGSEDEGMPSLKQYVEQQDPAVEEAIAKWQQLHEAALFDEWIANPDRNQGNLLWSGGEDWVLIDHALALWSSLASPNPRSEEHNGLAQVVVNLERDVGAARLRRLSGPFAEKCRALDRSELRAAAHCDSMGMSDHSKSALSSLMKRLEFLPALLARHGNQPELRHEY